MRILAFQVPHLVGTSSRVRLSHVRRTSDQDLDLLACSLNEALGAVKDEMDTFLSGHSSNKGEERDGVIQLLEVEVFHLDLFLR
jgi:hypothetical protein